MHPLPSFVQPNWSGALLIFFDISRKPHASCPDVAEHPLWCLPQSLPLSSRTVRFDGVTRSTLISVPLLMQLIDFSNTQSLLLLFVCLQITTVVHIVCWQTIVLDNFPVCRPILSQKRILQNEKNYIAIFEIFRHQGFNIIHEVHRKWP